MSFINRDAKKVLNKILEMYIRNYIPWKSGDCFRDALLVWYYKINQCNPLHYHTKEKSCDHINQHKKNLPNSISFMIKTLRKIEIEGNFLSSIKTVYKKPAANTILMKKRSVLFP